MWTKIALIASLAAAIAGCERAAAGEKVIELRFWNSFTGPDGRTMLGIVKDFNESHRGVHVTMQRMEAGPYYNKLFVAGLGGRAPEVFVSHVFALSRLVRAGFVRPVDDFATGEGAIDIGDIDANVWNASAHDGKHFGVPLDIHLLGMYYNRKLFAQAGIERPPTNREEFIAALRKLRRLNGADTWGFVFTWQRTNLFTMCRQNGGRFFDEQMTRPTFASAENVEALRFARQLIEQDLVPAPQDFDSWIGFRQGKVGIVFEGIYMLPDLQRQKDLEYGAAPVPQLFDHPGAWAESHNLCVRADVSGEQLAAVKKFIRYLSDNSLDWAEGGQIPVRKSLRESERFATMTAQREFARQIPDAQYLPAVPYVLEYIDQFQLAIDRALRGEATPEEAMKFADANVAKVMARYRAAENTAVAEAAR
jgi:multiple sugar transport system substrate-binding protein